jgi:hypothetical protein
VGDEVVGEGGEAVEARQVGDAGAVEVGGGELGALEEGDRATLIVGDVGEGIQEAKIAARSGVDSAASTGSRKRPPCSAKRRAPTSRSAAANWGISGCSGS